MKDCFYETMWIIMHGFLYAQQQKFRRNHLNKLIRQDFRNERLSSPLNDRPYFYIISENYSHFMIWLNFWLRGGQKVKYKNKLGKKYLLEVTMSVYTT